MFTLFTAELLGGVWVFLNVDKVSPLEPLAGVKIICVYKQINAHVYTSSPGGHFRDGKRHRL